MWLYQAPNKRIFQAGPSRTMHWIDVEGNGSVTVAGERSDDADAMNGNALMYDIGKILTLGGSPTYSLHSDGSNRSYIALTSRGIRHKLRAAATCTMPVPSITR